MRWYHDIPWWGIMTTKHSINQYIEQIDHEVPYKLVFCMVTPKDHPRYLPTMICLCMKLQMLNYMRYRTDKGICKLTAEQYNHKIFDGELETEQEFSDTAWTMNPALADDPDAVSTLWKKLIVIRVLWCNMIASPEDRPWISEMMYAFEYVMSHKYVPMPKYKGEDLILPCNYRNFHFPDYEECYPYKEIGGPESDYAVWWRDRYRQNSKKEKGEVTHN